MSHLTNHTPACACSLVCAYTHHKLDEVVCLLMSKRKRADFTEDVKELRAVVVQSLDHNNRALNIADEYTVSMVGRG